jgi:glycosyltransferase involved in cell wall biosynthesis
VTPDPRVLVVTNMYPSDRDPAYGVFVQAQVQALAAEGLNVEVEFLDGRASKAAYLAINRVRHRVGAGRFDIVHAHYGLTGFTASFQSVPLVVTFHGDDLLGTPSRSGGITIKSRLSRWLSRAAAPRAAALICVSEQLRLALPRARDRERARVIPGGIDTERFSPGDRLAARGRLGLPGAAKIVLFPSTPGERRKRLDLAEAAVNELAGVRLLVVSRVRYEQMPDYYHAADCLLLTSDWEGSPTIVKEALCCDLPVVAVDAGDAWRWLRLAPGCQQVERQGGVPAIASGLRAVLDGSGRVDGARVRAEVDRRRIARDVIAVYRDVLSQRAKLQ